MRGCTGGREKFLKGRARSEGPIREGAEAELAFQEQAFDNQVFQNLIHKAFRRI